MNLVLVGLEGEGESCWNLPGSSSLDRSFHWSIQKTLIIPEHTGGAHIASLLYYVTMSFGKGWQTNKYP